MRLKNSNNAEQKTYEKNYMKPIGIAKEVEPKRNEIQEFKTARERKGDAGIMVKKGRRK